MDETLCIDDCLRLNRSIWEPLKGDRSDWLHSVSRMSHHTDESLEDHSATLMKAAINQLGFDLVEIARIQHVARTIANLDHSERIGPQHIAEAVNYRPLYGHI